MSYLVHEFARKIRLVFPSMPVRRALAIAEYHFSVDAKTKKIAHRHSGTEFVTCLVAAHVRHNLTDYESWFPAGYHTPALKPAARQAVQPQIDRYLTSWRG